MAEKPVIWKKIRLSSVSREKQRMKFQVETASLRGADAQLFAFFCPSRVTSRADIEETQYPIKYQRTEAEGIRILVRIKDSFF